MNKNPGNRKSNQANKGNDEQNSRESKSMTDLSRGNSKSRRNKHFVQYGRGSGRGRGDSYNNVPRDNPPSYNDAVSYTGQNMQKLRNPQTYPNQMYYGGASNFGYIQDPIMQGMRPLPSLLGNPQFNQSFCPPPYQQSQLFSLQNLQVRPQGQQFQQQGRPLQSGKFNQQYVNNQSSGRCYDRSQNKISSLTAKDLIRELVTYSGFCTELEMLIKKLHNDSKDIQTVINKYKGIFITRNDDLTGKLLVELSPKIKFCSEYMEETGCHRDRCFAIHTCQYNLFGSCSNKICPFGHNLNTNHNSHIFKNYELDEVTTSSLKDLLKKIINGSVYPKICVSYQREQCKLGKGCKELHICYDYVSSLGNCPNGDDCSLNHSIHDPGCVQVFNRFNISTNESPRDLLKLLVNHLQLSDEDKQSEMGSSTKSEERSDSSTRPKDRKRKDVNKINDSNIYSDDSGTKNQYSNTSDMNPRATKMKDYEKDMIDAKSKLKNVHLDDDEENDSEESCNITGVKGKNRKRNLNKRHGQNQGGIHEKPKPVESLTVFASNLKGNIAAPFICLPFMYKKCDAMKTGCKYLHTKNTFHWQFGDTNWFNFHFYHAKIIERHFRDVSSDGCTLPSIDRARLDRSMKNLPSMIGNMPLKVDFTNMTLSGEAVKVPYKIRHISTLSSVVSDDKFGTIFKWYFKNKIDKWQIYKVSKESTISSEDIERAFLNAPNDPFYFITTSFSYQLNFTNMTQINRNTMTIRAIRRRPEEFPTNVAAMVEKISLPMNWDKMDNNTDYNLVQIDEYSSEYSDVRQIVNLTLVCNIERIRRIQNEHLWRQFGNKKNELKAKYKQDFLNVQKLFYCVDDKHFIEVCRENLDWRMHDNNSIPKQFGQGAYFFNSAAAATMYAVPDNFGIKKLLVFEVIIGYLTKGSSSMTRPPENPIYNALFDTTVDNDTSPTTFVKYNKQEYYPSFVVQFK